MGQSLSDEVLYGQVPLGFRKDGSPFFAILGAAPDDEDDVDDEDDSDDEDSDEDDDDTDEGDDDEDSDEDDDSDEKDKSKKKSQKPDPKDKRIKELSDEAARRRRALRETRAKLTETEQRLTALEKKAGKKPGDKDEPADESQELSELRADVEKTKSSNRDLRIMNAFLTSNTHQFHDLKAAVKLLDLSDVDIDEKSGEVDGLDEAIASLVEQNPWLVKSSEDTSKGGSSKGSTSRGNSGTRRTGDRPGSRSGKAGLNEKALREKYKIN